MDNAFRINPYKEVDKYWLLSVERCMMLAEKKIDRLNDKKYNSEINFY